ncbi:MAG: protein kinase [Myxococcota bacterium]|nr:protein kinase [Myxococcota bacterium]
MPTPMELPRQYGDYELLERIATGGMAEVYLARAFGVEGFEKRLVIKRILPSLATSDRFVSLFIQEAKICSLLTHPNVVHVFDLGRVEKSHYIAMEHIYGRDLTRTVRKLRAQGQKLPLRFAVYIVACMARGLAYAHSRSSADGTSLGIVHRDISPHNIMLSFEGQVKVLDFGIARVEGTVAGGAEAQPGGGKFAYMSPEQASGESVDSRTDVFACGIVLYELLVNHRLFQHPNPEEKLRRVIEAEVPDPRTEAPEVSERLWEILQKALARDPADRYQEAAHLEEDLRALLFDEGMRADEALLGHFLRGLFSDEVSEDAAASQMGSLLKAVWEPVGSRDDLTSSHQTASGSSLNSDLTPHHVVERKLVSTLYVELIGLTEAWGELEPEHVLKKHNQLFRMVERVVGRYNGWIEGHSDEGFSILFGVPKMREDDLDRAMNCALHLQRTIRRARRRNSSVELAMGLHGGHVVWIEESARQRCLARGDAIKLARRLAASAQAGEVRVSGWVKDRADGWRFNEEQSLKHRGRKGSQEVWSVAGRWMKTQGHGPGRWESREGEVEMLSEALSGLARGQGGLVSVRGGVGSGKSRLVRELELLALKAGLPFYGGRALPYGSAPPMAMIRDIVAAYLGLSSRESPEVIRERLASLERLQVTPDEIATLGALFSLEIGGRFRPTKEDVYKAGLAFVGGVARGRSVLFVLEDLHHHSQLELDLLGHILENQGSIPLLWIVTHRGPLPDSLPAAQIEVVLAPLGIENQERMIAERFRALEVQPKLLELVVGTAEGNPLYVTEILKALEQQDAVRVEGDRVGLVDAHEGAQLPVSLDALIASRVDALESGEKQVLQTAALISPIFSEELLRLCVPAVEFEGSLETLVEHGLVAPHEEPGRYSFSTQLIWDVVRTSIVGSQLREIHHRISVGMEEHYEARIEGHYEALAEHCAVGDRLIKAARYFELAGDRHLLLGLLERAAGCYGRGTEVLEQEGEHIEESMRLEGLATLYLKMGRVAAMAGNREKAAIHLQLAQEISAEIAVVSLEVGCLVELGQLYVHQGKLDMARMIIEQGLSEAKMARLERPLAELYLTMGRLELEGGSSTSAMEAFESALEASGEERDLAAKSFSGLAQVHNRLGQPDLAMASLGQARVLSEEVGDRLLQARIVNNMGITHFSNGNFDAALVSFREALDVNRNLGYGRGVVYNLHNIGDVLFRQEEFAKAYGSFEQARQIARQYGMGKEVAFNEIYLGFLRAQQGEWEEGLEVLESGIDGASRHKDLETVLMGRLLQGRLLNGVGRHAEGRKILEVAMENARETEILWIVEEIASELGAL